MLSANADFAAKTEQRPPLISGWRREIFVLLLFSLPYLYFTWPVILSMGDSLPWGVFIPGHMWTMETIIQGVFEQGKLIAGSDMVGYPVNRPIVAIGWSFILPLMFFRLLGIKLILGLNVAIFLHFVLACYAAYRLALRFVRSHKAAFMAGLIFGYSPYILGIFWNGQLGKLSHGLFPILVILLLDIARTKKTWPLFLFGPAIVLLLASSPYYGIFAAILTLLVSGYFLWRTKRKNRLNLFGRLIMTAVVTTVFAAPFFYYFFLYQNSETRQSVPRLGQAMAQLPPYPLEYTENATLLGWLKPNPYHGSLTTKIGVYHSHYLGWLAVLLALAAFLRPRKTSLTGNDPISGARGRAPPLSRRFLLLVMVVFTLIASGYSLRFTLHHDTIFSHRIYLLPYWLNKTFSLRPVIGSFVRAAVVVTLCLSLLAAMGWQRLESLLKGRIRLAAGVFLALALVVEPVLALPLSFPLPTHRVEVFQVYRDLAEIHDRGAVLEIPYDSPDLPGPEWNTHYLFFQTIHRHPMIQNDRPLREYHQFPCLDVALFKVMAGYEKRSEGCEAPSLVGFRYLILHEDLIKPDKLTSVKKFLDKNLVLLREYPADGIRLYQTPSLPPGSSIGDPELAYLYYWSQKPLPYENKPPEKPDSSSDNAPLWL